MKLCFSQSLILLCVTLFFGGSQESYAQTLEEKEWIAEGNKYYLQKEFDKARVEYSKVLATSPASYKANFNLGNAYFELKNYKNAVTHFEKATKASPDKLEKANAFHNLGNSLLQQHEYKKAIESYKDALRNNPKDNETRYNLVLAKKLLNNQDKQQNPPDLPKPSEYAKQMKSKADFEAEKGKFEVARNLMLEAMQKDSTVMHYQSYIDKLTEIVVLDTIKLK
ncbi:tetratricopeptide repeat protein [Profundicola chukchiensis]|uniref:tetratricopeptide repeat protein n=1 Tax=Profundicola chukchiensis TaxID=2961959 RepID=UPI0026F3B74D|nr:tetratricopeptide repeat protein [Profundicola chukchiensis]